MKGNAVLFYAMAFMLCVSVANVHGYAVFKGEEKKVQLNDFVKRIIPAIDTTPTCATKTTCTKLSDCPQQTHLGSIESGGRKSSNVML